MNKITIKNPKNICVEEEFMSDDKTVTLEVDELAQVSDDYHTITELYDHRVALFIALCRILSRVAAPLPQPWRSKKHSDGTDAYEGWFVLGIGKKDGEIMTYHVPLSEWENTNFAETVECAYFDGHTSQDVLKRLKSI